MTSHHFFVDRGALDGATVRLSGAEAHHAARVLRVGTGERISIADGSGLVALAVVTDVGDEVVAEIEDRRCVPSPAPRLTLLQAAAKGDKLEDVITRATEVGVDTIVPFMGHRSVARWDDRKAGRLHDRWTQIARAAAKQCKAPTIPRILPLAPDAVGAIERGVPSVVLHETADDRLRDVLPAEAPPRLALVVGPEGGFSDEEIAMLREAGALVAGLGPRILRTETAGPAAAAVVGYRYGWFG